MKKAIQILFLELILGALSISVVSATNCGETFTVLAGSDIAGICNCSTSNNQASVMVPSTGLLPGYQTTTTYCCGFYKNGLCRTYENEKVYGCGETNSKANIPDGFTCECTYNAPDGSQMTGQWESYWQSKFWGNRGICCGWTTEDRKQCLNKPPGINDVYCGTEFDPQSNKQCICSFQETIEGRTGGNTQCCGWMRDGKCQSTDVGINDVEVTAETLNNLNPINIGGGSADLKTPGGIISRALKFFVFPIAGIILFVVLILGGFQMLAGANNSKSLEEGKQRITAAIIGFILLFAAYWIAQLLEIVFGIRILS